MIFHFSISFFSKKFAFCETGMSFETESASKIVQELTPLKLRTAKQALVAVSAVKFYRECFGAKTDYSAST